MINIIVELDETKEPKELVEYLKKNHNTMHYCKDCVYRKETGYNIGYMCAINQMAVLDEDFCSWSSAKLNLSSLYGEFHEHK